MSCFYSNPGTYFGDPLSENMTLSKLDFDQNVSERVLMRSIDGSSIQINCLKFFHIRMTSCHYQMASQIHELF